MIIISHGGEYIVSGPLPQPIDIPISFNFDVAWPIVWGDDWMYAGYTATATVFADPHSVAYVGEQRTLTGIHPVDWSNVFTLSDAHRDIEVGIYTTASGGFVMGDAYVGFNLPDNLIATAVPEISTWLMLLLGFAIVGLRRRCTVNYSPTLKSP